MVFFRCTDVEDYLQVCCIIALSDAGLDSEAITMLTTSYPKPDAEVSSYDLLLTRVSTVVPLAIAKNILSDAHGILCMSGSSPQLTSRLLKTSAVFTKAQATVSGLLKCKASPDIVSAILDKISESFSDSHIIGDEFFSVLIGAIQNRVSGNKAVYLKKMSDENFVSSSEKALAEDDSLKVTRKELINMSAMEYSKAASEIRAASLFLFKHTFQLNPSAEMCFSIWDWVCCEHADNLRSQLHAKVGSLVSSIVDDTSNIGHLPDLVPTTVLEESIGLNSSYRTKLSHIFRLLSGVSAIVFDRNTHVDYNGAESHIAKGNSDFKATSGFTFLIDRCKDVWEKYSMASVIVRGLVACRAVYWELLDNGINPLSVDTAVLASIGLSQSGHTLEEAVMIADRLRVHINVMNSWRVPYYLSCLTSCGNLHSDKFYRGFANSKHKTNLVAMSLTSASITNSTKLGSPEPILSGAKLVMKCMKQLFDSVNEALAHLKNCYLELEPLLPNATRELKSLAQLFGYSVDSDPGYPFVSKDSLTGRYSVQVDAQGLPLAPIDYCGAKAIQFVQRWGPDIVTPYRMCDFTARVYLRLLQFKKDITSVISVAEESPIPVKNLTEAYQYMLLVSEQEQSIEAVKSILSGDWGDIDLYLIVEQPEITAQSHKLLLSYESYYVRSKIKKVLGNIANNLLQLQNKCVVPYFPDFCGGAVARFLPNADALLDMESTKLGLLVTDEDFVALLRSGELRSSSDGFLTSRNGSSIIGRKGRSLYLLHNSGKWVLAAGSSGINWYLFSEIKIGGMSIDN